MTFILEVSNLGPLRSAKVELADFTLFVGKNNTGKTFLATVFHRVLEAKPSFSRLAIEQSAAEDLANWITTGYDKPQDANQLIQDATPQPHQRLIDWADTYSHSLLNHFGDNVRRRIEYAFGVDASELRRRTKSRRASNCYLRISNRHPGWDVEVRFDSDDVIIKRPDPIAWLHSIREAHSRNTKDHIGPPMNLLIDYYFSDQWIDTLFTKWPAKAVHLPAGRTGIMQSHEVLTSVLLEQRVMAGIRSITVGQFPGTLGDFLRLIVGNPTQPSHPRSKSSNVLDLIATLEQQMGAVIERDEETRPRHSIVARTPVGTFPLSRTSSMISELAPMLFVLKEAVRPGDHITIDEPEAHLHPNMHLTMASFLALLVKAGFRVLLTTHSDFFLGRLNNIIKAGALTGTQQKALPLDIPAIRTTGDIRASLFYSEKGWCEARDLVIDPIDGIDESTFGEVMEALYDESAEIVDMFMGWSSE